MASLRKDAFFQNGLLTSFLLMITLGFSLTHAASVANPAVSKTQLQHESDYLGKQLQYYIDPMGNKTIEELISMDESQFSLGQSDVLNFGFINQYVWIRWQPNETLKDTRHNHMMSIDFAAINEIEWYSVHQGVPVREYVTGTNSVFSSRPIKQVEFSFPLMRKGKMPEAVYLRVRASNALILPIKIRSNQEMYSEKYKKNLLWGALFGLLILISIINLFLFVLIKKTYYLYYMGYTLFVGLILSSLSGHGFMVLWPNLPDVNRFSIAFFTCVMIFFGLMFSMEYLSVKKYSVKTYNFGVFFSILALSVAIVSLFISYDMSFVAALLASFFAPFAAFLGFQGIKRKKIGAKIYTAAWMIYLIGVSHYALIVLNVIEASMFKMHLKEFGAIAEMLLLSIGIAIQMRNALNKQRELQLQVSDTLRERNEALQKSAKTKEELFTIMTHELRTPMNGIIGSIDNMIGASDFSGANAAFVALKHSSYEMMHLVESMLLYQEIHAGGVQMDNRSIDFIDALEKTSHHYTVLCESKGLQFQYQPLGEIPKYIHVDGYKLFTSLYKVIDNAVKFTESGRVALRVAFSYHSPSGALEFTVIDSGYGIDGDRLDTLFQPFEQDSVGLTRGSGGLGLGLVLVKGLVDLLGGELEVKSTIHCGTSVTLKIPVTRTTEGQMLDFDWGEETNDLPKGFGIQFPDKKQSSDTLSMVADASDQSLPKEEALELKPVNVLIVEDNPTNALMMKTFVRRLGYQYEHAENGALAVKIYQEKDIDIIFMDLQMPVMDGIEATQAIRAWELEQGKSSKVPIIACTANTTMNDRKACIDRGMDAFLAKPIKAVMIQNQIDQLVLKRKPIEGPKGQVVDFKNKKK